MLRHSLLPAFFPGVLLEDLPCAQSLIPGMLLNIQPLPPWHHLLSPGWLVSHSRVIQSQTAPNPSFQPPAFLQGCPVVSRNQSSTAEAGFMFWGVRTSSLE